MARNIGNDIDDRGDAKPRPPTAPPSPPPPRIQKRQNDSSKGRTLGKSKQPRENSDGKYAHHHCRCPGNHSRERSMCNPTQEPETTRIQINETSGRHDCHQPSKKSKKPEKASQIPTKQPKTAELSPKQGRSPVRQ